MYRIFRMFDFVPRDFVPLRMRSTAASYWCELKGVCCALPRSFHVFHTTESSAKLPTAQEKLSSFESAILKENARRKLEEENKFKKVDTHLVDITNQLKREVRERIASRENLQRMTEEAANQMLCNLQFKLARRVHIIAEKLDDIISKCAILEDSVNGMAQKLSSSLDLKMLQNDLNDLNRNIKNDIAIKMEKDTSIVNRLSHLDYAIKSKLHDGMLLYQESIKELKMETGQLSELIRVEPGPLCSQISDELENLKQALELTTKARKDSDNSIIQAIDQMMCILPHKSEGP